MEKNNQILETNGTYLIMEGSLPFHISINGKGNAGFMNFIKKYVEEVLILENFPDQ